MVGPFEQSGEEIMCLAVFQSGETLQSVQIDGFFPRISHISSDLDKFDTNNNPIQLIQDYIYIYRQSKATINIQFRPQS